MLKIFFLGLCWLAASSYGKTPKEWLFHFQQGNFIEKAYQIIVTAVLCVLLIMSITDLYNNYLDFPQETPPTTPSNPPTPFLPPPTHFLQNDINNEKTQLLEQELALKALLKRFEPHTFRYYVSKDHKKWTTIMQKNCQELIQHKTDVYEQQFLKLQCQNNQYRQYITYLTDNYKRIEQLSQEYQILFKKYQAQYALMASNETPHHINHTLKNARTQCEKKIQLLENLQCKIKATNQAITLLSQLKPTKLPNDSSPSQIDLDNLF